ncbi:MAG: ATP-binding protein [Lachnospiraceae bacterium]|nr:ATP-binding protein [Lachnospiraceae bacterium]
MGINKKEISNTTSDQEKFVLLHPRYSFDDIVLTHVVKEQLKDFISFYKNRGLLFNEWGLSKRYKDRNNLCLNFYGDSGSGKTMTAHALINFLGKEVLQVNYADIESKYVGETSKNLQELFRFASENGAVILLDEADALLSRRVTDMSSATDVSVNQTRSVLLTLLDMYDGIVIFTTNFISNYDAAFMRRIQHHIHFELPNCEQREELWKFYLDTGVPHRVNMKELAEKYEGISGAYISYAVFQAAITTARKAETVMSQDNLEHAVRQIMESKRAHDPQIKVTKREVPEEYVREQTGGKIQ